MDGANTLNLVHKVTLYQQSSNFSEHTVDYIKCHFLCFTLETLTWAIWSRNRESKFLTRPQVILVLIDCNGYFKPYKIRENGIRLSHTHHLASVKIINTEPVFFLLYPTHLPFITILY